MYFYLGRSLPDLKEIDQDPILSLLEYIIKSKRPDLLYAVHNFYAKLKELQSQAAENPQNEILRFNEVDGQILLALILWYGGGSGDTVAAALKHTISIIVDVMNELRWPYLSL